MKDCAPIFIIAALSVLAGLGLASAFAGSVNSQNPNPPRPLTTIAALPTCSAATEGYQFVISNGIASPAYGQTVSATGSAHHIVTCMNSAWIYE